MGASEPPASGYLVRPTIATPPTLRATSPNGGGHDGTLLFRTANPIHAQFETRDAQNIRSIDGYFAVFHSPYEITPGVREFVHPDAFNDTLDRDIRALINHDSGLVLGRTSANTLALHVDPHGLAGSILINPDDTDAMNLYARVKRGDVTQCSFGFDITDEETVLHEDLSVDFIIKAVRLWEVSVVTFPAYEATNVTARAAQLAQIRRDALEVRKNALLARLGRGK